MAGRREGQAFLPTTANLSLTHVSEQRLDRVSNGGRIQFLHDNHDSVTVQKKQFSKASLRTWSSLPDPAQLSWPVIFPDSCKNISKKTQKNM